MNTINHLDSVSDEIKLVLSQELDIELAIIFGSESNGIDFYNPFI